MARLVDEGMRMEDHPGVLFRDGPAGRRAGLAGGPDVWEVIVGPPRLRLRRRGWDVIAAQETPSLRGLPDAQLFVATQLAQRCLVTENISDFVLVESAWRAEHQEPHHGLILVAPGAFPRHQQRSVGRLVAALERLMKAGHPEPGLVAWLETS